MDRKRENKERDNACKMEENTTKNNDSIVKKHAKMVNKGTQKETQKNNNKAYKCIYKRKIKSNNFLRGAKTNANRKSNSKEPECIASEENDDICEWEYCSISKSLLENRKEAEMAASKLLEDHKLTPLIVDSSVETVELPVLVIEGKMSELKEDLDEISDQSGSSILGDEETSRTETDASSKDESNDETTSIIRISMRTKGGHTTEQNMLMNNGDNQMKNDLRKTCTKSGSQNVSMLPKEMVIKKNSEKIDESEYEEREICSTKVPEECTKLLLEKNVSKTCERNRQLGERKRLELSIDAVDFNYEKKETERIEVGTRNEDKNYDDVNFISAKMKVKVVKVNTSMTKIRKTQTKKTQTEKPYSLNEHKTSKREEKARNSNKREERGNKVELSRTKTSEDYSSTKNGCLQRESGIYSMQEEDTLEISLNNSLSTTTSLKQRSSVADSSCEATSPITNRRNAQQFSAQNVKNKAVEMTRSRKEARRKELQRKVGCETVNVKENGNLVVKPQSSQMIARQKLKKSAISWSSVSNQSIAKEPLPLIQRTAVVQETDGYEAPPPSMVSSMYEKGRNPREKVTSQPDAPVPTSEAPRPSLCERREGRHDVKIKATSNSSLKKLRGSFPDKSSASQLVIGVQPQVRTSNDDVRPSGDHVPERTQVRR